MQSGTRFRINSPIVVNEVFDDEVIIINLDSGNYYSLDSAGVDIWNFIGIGATVGEISGGVACRYKGDCLEIENGVGQLLEELQREELIVPVQTQDPETGKAAMPVEVNPEAERLDYSAPTLQKYSDMQDLLLLDPIHEVDETGWPTRPAEPST